MFNPRIGRLDDDLGQQRGRQTQDADETHKQEKPVPVLHLCLFLSEPHKQAAGDPRCSCYCVLRGRFVACVPPLPWIVLLFAVPTVPAVITIPLKMLLTI